MATYYARKTGNINAADVWATTPTGTASDLFPTFTNIDVLMANNFTVTLNVSATVGEIRNDTIGGATAGGSFTLGNGVTITANLFRCNAGAALINQTGGNSGTLNGNVLAGSNVNSHGINKTSTGVLNITGNLTGGVSTISNALVLTAGTVNITGVITGGSGSPTSGSTPYSTAINMSGGTLNVLSGSATGGSANDYHGIYCTAGTINFTGTASGSATSSLTNAHGIRNESGINTITINGNVVGGRGGNGLINISTATIVVNGSAVGGENFTGLSNSLGTARVKRAVGNGFGAGSVGLSSSVGVSAGQNSQTTVEEIEYGILGQSPTSGPIRLKKANTNVAVFNYADTAGAKTLIDATANAAMPAATDVRSGVSYASGALTGTCAVPAAGSVSLGVAVDNTTGTAFVTGSDIATAVWGAATRSITGGTVDTLTNAPASVTPSDIWSHSSRTLTSASGPTAIEIRQELDSNSTQLSAIKSKTDALPSDPADQSLLEAAIAGVTAPSASTVAAAVRSELSVELARVDQAVSSRLAASEASKLDAVKAKTDLLQTDRLAQCSTVATTGAQLAAALS